MGNVVDVGSGAVWPAELGKISRVALEGALEKVVLPRADDPTTPAQAAAWQSRVGTAAVPDISLSGLDEVAEFLRENGDLPPRPAGDRQELPQPVLRRLLERLRQIGLGERLLEPLVLLPAFVGVLSSAAVRGAREASSGAGAGYFRQAVARAEDVRRAADRLIGQERGVGCDDATLQRFLELRDGVEVGRRFLMLALAHGGAVSQGEVWGAAGMESVVGKALVSAPLAKLVGLGGGLADDNPASARGGLEAPRSYPKNWQAVARRGGGRLRVPRKAPAGGMLERSRERLPSDGEDEAS